MSLPPTDVSKLIYLLPLALVVFQIATLNLLPLETYDEIYYVKFASDYLTGNPFYDAHPPLGKLIISLSLTLFGNNPFGWRLLSSLSWFGVVLIGALLAKKLFARPRAVLITLTLLSFESLLFVLGRFALLDIFGVLLSLTGILFAYRYRDKRLTKYLILSSILMGLAIGVKWSNAVLLIAPILIITQKETSRLKVLLKMLALAVVSYLATFLPNILMTENIFDWHIKTFSYHTDFADFHRYHSPWWSWWLNYHPTWLKFDQYNELVSGVLALGNPIIFPAVLVAILVSLKTLGRKIDHNLAPLLIAFLVFNLQWILLKRESFNYNIAPSVPLGILILSYWLDKLWGTKFGSSLVLSFLSLVMLTFFFFLPLLIGWPVPYTFFQRHIWLPSWT